MQLFRRRNQHDLRAGRPDLTERQRTAGCRYVHLETAVDNVPALAFYKRHGYNLEKTAPRYYSNGVDAFMLKKDLLPPPPAS